MCLGKTIRLNFSTLGNQHCHDVELVEYSHVSLTIQAKRDIPLDQGRILRAGQQAWLPRVPMSSDPIGDEVRSRPSALVIYHDH
jgi:hypothetical protein